VSEARAKRAGALFFTVKNDQKLSEICAYQNSELQPLGPLARQGMPVAGPRDQISRGNHRCDMWDCWVTASDDQTDTPGPPPASQCQTPQTLWKAREGMRRRL
jgi:hypothetical protein